MTLRRYITLIETASLEDIARRKESILPSIISSMDSRSVASVLEVDDESEQELASQWFDVCMNMYRHMFSVKQIPIYRHMMVYNTKEFIALLKDGSGVLGKYWSINPDIESPTWAQDQHGDIPVVLDGEIDVSQVDWMATLRQNFEWPHEGEVIFSGDVRVLYVEDRDTGKRIKLNKICKR